MGEDGNAWEVGEDDCLIGPGEYGECLREFRAALRCCSPESSIGEEDNSCLSIGDSRSVLIAVVGGGSAAEDSLM